jgi:hypothetical protein
MVNTETAKPVVSTTQRVMKICLIVSIALACLMIILAWFSGRGVLNVSGGLIPLVAIQWFFYLAVKAKAVATRKTN